MPAIGVGTFNAANDAFVLRNTATDRHGRHPLSVQCTGLEGGGWRLERRRDGRFRRLRHNNRNLVAEIRGRNGASQSRHVPVRHARLESGCGRLERRRSRRHRHLRSPDLDVVAPPRRFAGVANAGTFQFGAAGGMPVVGDWDGDGRDGIGVLKNGRWQLRQTADAGAADAGVFRFGPIGAMAVAGDWNGDGVDGVGTFNPVTAHWRLRQTATAGRADAGNFIFGRRGRARSWAASPRPLPRRCAGHGRSAALEPRFARPGGAHPAPSP